MNLNILREIYCRLIFLAVLLFARFTKCLIRNSLACKLISDVIEKNGTTHQLKYHPWSQLKPKQTSPTLIHQMTQTPEHDRSLAIPTRYPIPSQHRDVPVVDLITRTRIVFRDRTGAKRGKRNVSWCTLIRLQTPMMTYAYTRIHPHLHCTYFTHYTRFVHFVYSIPSLVSYNHLANSPFACIFTI